MYIKTVFVVSDTDVLKIAREAGYEEYLEGVVDSVAPLFWSRDFANDSYKSLYIDDEAYNEIIQDIDHCLDPDFFDEEEMNELVAKKVVIKALREYCVDNGIDTDSVLVDVSW